MTPTPPELWRRFTITLRRTLARQAGLTNKALAAQVRVSYAKVIRSAETAAADIFAQAVMAAERPGC